MAENLQEVLARVAEAAPGADAEVGASFVASRLIIPLNSCEAAPDGGSVAHVELLAQETEPGLAALVAFTDEAAFNLWGRTPSYAIATGIELCGLALTKRLNGLCVNPGGPVTVTWDNDELSALWERHSGMGMADGA